MPFYIMLVCPSVPDDYSAWLDLNNRSQAALTLRLLVLDGGGPALRGRLHSHGHSGAVEPAKRDGRRVEKDDSADHR
jgi:hypothetical protein